jgi:hypothetical protein
MHEVAAGAGLVADRGGGGGDLAERSPRSTTRGGQCPARGGERLEVVHEVAAGAELAVVADRGGGVLAELSAVVNGSRMAVVAELARWTSAT